METQPPSSSASVLPFPEFPISRDSASWREELVPVTSRELLPEFCPINPLSTTTEPPLVTVRELSGLYRPTYRVEPLVVVPSKVTGVPSSIWISAAKAGRVALHSSMAIRLFNFITGILPLKTDCAGGDRHPIQLENIGGMYRVARRKTTCLRSFARRQAMLLFYPFIANQTVCRRPLVLRARTVVSSTLKPAPRSRWSGSADQMPRMPPGFRAALAAAIPPRV